MKNKIFLFTSLILFIVFFFSSLSCGRLVHRIKPNDLREKTRIYINKVINQQVNEIKSYGLINTSSVKNGTYLQNYNKTKQQRFCLMVNLLRKEIEENGWSQDIVKEVYSWMIKNQVYRIGEHVKYTVSLHQLYNNKFTGDCKSLHFGMAAILKYYLDCPYDMQIVVYEPLIEPGWHFTLKVNGTVYDLQKMLAIVGTGGLSLIRTEFAVYDIY